QRFSQEFGRLPDYDEIEKATEIPKHEIHWLFEIGGRSMSFQNDTGQFSPHTGSIWDFTANESESSPRHHTDIAILKERLKEAYRKLPKRDQQILYLRHYTQLRGAEIAKLMNVSPGRISQIYNEILVKLRILIDPPPQTRDAE
ncbi:MAG: sigma-70 family RNA polymerase sigma factor, partial [Lentisphaerae bacterium]